MLWFDLDRIAIECVGQFGKLSHHHRPIAAVCPYTQWQSDLDKRVAEISAALFSTMFIA
jgi:hypothetical protein